MTHYYQNPQNERIRETVKKGTKRITPGVAKQTAGREEELNSKFAKTPGWFGRQINKIRLMFWLIKDWKDGKYKQVPWTTIAMVTFAIIYFLNPFDLIPDFVPVAGYIDDAAVIGFVFAAVEFDLKIYAQWKGLDPSLFWS